jgi:putative transposase
VSDRTLDRYRKAMREAGESLVDQHLALTTKYDRCGDRKRKISQELIDLIDKIAREQFNNARNITKKAAYLYLLQACHQADVKPCSLKTFYKELERRKSVRARKGKRWAYQTDPIVWYLQLNEAIHGARPFQYVHIDHTELDLLLCMPGRKRSLGKVWLTLAVDAESRAVLGFCLSFEAPSYRSCMMVLRDIVRRHGRMPEMLVLDNGKDFHSRALQRVCQLYGCSIRYRPPAQARFGSVLERLFGTLNSQFIHLLEGNTQLMKHVRMTTKSVMPENFEVWSLPALHAAMEYFCTRLYGTETHPAHGEAPIDYLERRWVETGERRNRLVRFDDTFRIETCPSPQEGDTRVLDSQRGVKINHIWYWNEAFKKSGLAGKAVDVRIDPWDVRVAYALVGGQWYRCISKLNGLLRNRTVVELRYAYDEILRKYRTPKRELSPERVAEYLRVLDAKAFDPRLTDQQAEAKAVYGPLGMTQAVMEEKRHPSEAPKDGAAPEGASQPIPLKPKRTPMPPAAKASNDGLESKPAHPRTPQPPAPPASDISEHDDDYALF